MEMRTFSELNSNKILNNKKLHNIPNVHQQQKGYIYSYNGI